MDPVPVLLLQPLDNPLQVLDVVVKVGHLPLALALPSLASEVIPERVEPALVGQPSRKEGMVGLVLVS